MQKDRRTVSVFIFIGLLLIVFFAVGMVVSRNPGAFYSRYRVDYALDSFVSFCAGIWVPAGIIGFPMFLIALIVSCVQESRRKDKE